MDGQTEDMIMSNEDGSDAQPHQAQSSSAQASESMIDEDEQDRFEDQPMETEAGDDESVEIISSAQTQEDADHLDSSSSFHINVKMLKSVDDTGKAKKKEVKKKRPKLATVT